MPEEVTVIIVVGMLIGFALGVLGMVKTIVIKKYEARREPDADGVRADIAMLSQRLDALEEGILIRLQDVEERMDFTERMLAQGRRPGELPERR